MSRARYTIKILSIFIGFILIAFSSHSSDWLKIEWRSGNIAIITADIPEKMDTPEFEAQLRNILIDECRRKDKYLTRLLGFNKSQDAISSFLVQAPAVWGAGCTMDIDIEKVRSWTEEERKSIQELVYALEHSDIELALENFRGRCVSPFLISPAAFTARKTLKTVNGKLFAIGGIKQIAGLGQCVVNLGKSPFTKTSFRLEWKYENLPREDVLWDGWDKNYNQVTLKLILGNDQLADKRAYRDVFKEIEATIFKETGQSPIFN